MMDSKTEAEASGPWLSFMYTLCQQFQHGSYFLCANHLTQGKPIDSDGSDVLLHEAKWSDL